MLQAKFRARPEGTERDTVWFLAQVKKELTARAKSMARPNAPEQPKYVVFVTNVVLSPVSEVGGVDTVDREIRSLRDKLGLPFEDWRVWHRDTLGSFLDVHVDVRRTYAGQITAGDILTYLMSVLEGSGFQGVGELATSYAVMEMAADQWVRLDQAGEGNNQALPLAEVGVDLAAVLEDAEPGRKHVQVLRHVLAQGDRILRPSVHRDRSVPHVAVVGGPGQGKTTLCQLLCQAYRVAFLAESPDRLDQTNTTLLKALRARLEGLGIEAPAQHRWPVRIDLAAYADALAGGTSVGLLRFLAQRISESTPDVSPNALRAWLTRWPCLVVLDGLDEVAGAEARAGVLRKIEEFFTDARQVNADLFVVVTTRPQGYHHKFAPERFEHLQVTPLGEVDALAYAEQLVGVRFPGAPLIARKVLDRLRAAAREPLTARLMSTPLQVTIMSVLLERRERVPQERYRLFRAYYDRAGCLHSTHVLRAAVHPRRTVGKPCPDRHRRPAAPAPPTQPMG